MSAAACNPSPDAEAVGGGGSNSDPSKGLDLYAICKVFANLLPLVTDFIHQEYIGLDYSLDFTDINFVVL